MKNKIITGAIAVIVILFSFSILNWYLNTANERIVNMEAPHELGIEELGYLKITLQNDAPRDVNVTINVKNAFVDKKGVSLKTSQVVVYDIGDLDYIPPHYTYKPLDEVLLKPGRNNITVLLGYQVPGFQEVEVEVYRHGKLKSSGSTGINVVAPIISINLWNHEGINGTDEIYTVYGELRLTGKGSAKGVVVNISAINELTNTTVSTVTRTYSLNTERYEPLIVWEKRNTTYDPVTQMRTTITTETFAPIAVIELSKGEPSAEKYIMSPIVVKGEVGDRYKVVATARWMDKGVSSEVRIP